LHLLKRCFAHVRALLSLFDMGWYRHDMQYCGKNYRRPAMYGVELEERDSHDSSRAFAGRR